MLPTTPKWEHLGIKLFGSKSRNSYICRQKHKILLKTIKRLNKTLFTLFVAIVATNLNAQLVVDSLGRVGVGTLTPWEGPALLVGN